MSINLSKRGRKELLSKIGEVRAFISPAPQDENTGNLLCRLCEIEKEINLK